MLFSKNSRMAIATCLFASMGSHAFAQSNTVELFQSFEPAAAVQSDDEQLSIIVEDDPSVVSVVVGFIDTNSLSDADGLTLSLPGGGGVFNSGVLELSERAPMEFSLYAGDVGETETDIVIDGEDVVGTLRTGEKDYRIVPLGDGRHALIEVDYSRLEDHPEDYDEGSMESYPPTEEQMQALEDDHEGHLHDNAGQYDIIVAYTNRARLQAGNINALIQQSIDNTNRSYANSGINTRVRLVQAYQTNYTESGNVTTDRNRFRAVGDGFMDEIHTRRNTTRADVAMLLVGSGSGCGIAAAILANAETAFAVTRQNCSAGNMTFAHEIGHLQGARHNPEADDTSTPFSYGHGFCNDPRNWRTVMSYNSGSRCPSRQQVWSGPNARFGGVATGDAALRDNVRVLNGTAGLVANFRSRADGTCRSGFTAAGSRLCIHNNVRSARSYANAEVYCKDRRARVANYGDLRYLYVRTALDAAYNPRGRWIGDWVGDDNVLCGNRTVSSDGDNDIGNFEGTCNRFDNRGFWCAYDR